MMKYILLTAFLVILDSGITLAAKPDPCLSDPCQNGGTCTPIRRNNRYRCACTSGFHGASCQLPIGCGGCDHDSCVVSAPICSGARPCCAGYSVADGNCVYDASLGDFILGPEAVNFCSNPPITPGSQIVNGEDAVVEDFPWQAGLWRATDKSKTRITFICGAIILGPRIILTAAHCVKNIAPSWLFVAVGRTALLASTGYYIVSDIVLHPDYKSIGHIRLSDNDIALIQLRDSLTMSATVQPACLPRECFSDADIIGQTCTISGFGRNGDGEISQILQKVDVLIQPDDFCKATYSLKSDYDDLLCLSGTNERPATSCKGDSGGPCTQGSVVIGVTSWGSSECDVQFPFGYTSVHQYYGWILSVVEGWMVI